MRTRKEAGGSTALSGDQGRHLMPGEAPPSDTGPSAESLDMSEGEVGGDLFYLTKRTKRDIWDAYWHDDQPAGTIKKEADGTWSATAIVPADADNATGTRAPIGFGHSTTARSWLSGFLYAAHLGIARFKGNLPAEPLPPEPGPGTINGRPTGDEDGTGDGPVAGTTNTVA